MSKHELVELDLSPAGTWMTRCSCGWTNYYVMTALFGVQSFIRHQYGTGEDWYTWADMEHEYAEGHFEGKTIGFDEGWELGRKELIEELQALKEATAAPTERDTTND